MKKRFSTYWLALGIVILLAVWLTTGDVQSLRDQAPQAAAVKEKGATRVAYRLGTAVTVNRQLPVQGQLEAWRAVEIQARVSGTVASLPVDKGQRVKAGQELVILSEEDRPAQLARAKAEVELARTELSGTQALAKRQLAAETDIKNKEAALARANATLAEMGQRLSDTRIKAPFAGVIQDQPVELGQSVQPGTSLVHLVDDNKLKMVGQVPQQMVSSLKAGQRVTAQLLDGRELQGELTFIGYQADVQTRTFRIEAALDNPQHLRLAGSTVTLAIELGEVLAHEISPALLSLNRQGQLSVEHVGEDGRVVQTPVERVRTSPSAIWVTGLPEQVRFITMGRGFVTPGTQVEAVEESKLTAGSPNG